MMSSVLWLSVSLLVLVQVSAVENCHPGCRCDVESFGLFDSFSLTRVDCSGLKPGATMPIPIPLDTAHLDLSSISMGQLTDAMLSGPGYTTLVSLDLSSNHITTVSPSALSRLRYLESLDLSHNSLTALTLDLFYGLPLSDVDISYNDFHDFDMNVFATKVNAEPVTLDLSNNKLTTVTTAANGKTLHIQSLNLSANLFTSVPKLSGLPLRYLNMDANPIKRIREAAFLPLEELVYLSISGCKELWEIEQFSFKGLQSLQVLDLSNNPNLKKLDPKVFMGLDSLQELNLSNSGVVSLQNDMLAHLPSIKSITLGQDIRCWKTKKPGQFHLHLGQLQPTEVLICNAEGIGL
uniref:Tsukushi small leucine rich proteoglycan homolog (Xenopus laevis) n=1 Tax=Neogobius melanostomus TaxID=47308 RepID=A0A8C6WKU5_9GOBI